MVINLHHFSINSEMYVSKTYLSLEEPPSAAMFKHYTKQPKKSPDLSSTVVDGMVTVMNTLCQALTQANKQTEKQSAPSPTPTFSPMKQVQLCSTYLKQLSELRDLHDAGVLHQDEQRSDNVNLLHQLK